MDQVFRSVYLGSDWALFPGYSTFMLVFTWFAILVEPFVMVALWWPRLRLPGVIVGSLFHLLLYWSLPVGTFSLTVIVLYLAAFDADAVHRFVDRMNEPEPVGS